MDKYSITIEGEDKKAMKQRKKAIKKLQKAEYRRWIMKYITNNVGKDLKRLLKHITIVDKTTNEKSVIYDRVTIESKLIE